MHTSREVLVPLSQTGVVSTDCWLEEKSGSFKDGSIEAGSPNKDLLVLYSAEKMKSKAWEQPS